MGGSPSCRERGRGGAIFPEGPALPAGEGGQSGADDMLVNSDAPASVRAGIFVPHVRVGR